MKTLFSVVAISMMLFFSCNEDSEKGCSEYQEPFIQCACTKEYNPVCGCNGKTYGNPCSAECLQVPSYEMGACEE